MSARKNRGRDVTGASSGRDAMGLGLAALNRLASAGGIDRLRLRKPMERAIYEASRGGFKTVGAVNRAFTAVQGAGKAQRPTTSGDRGLFDLTPTDDQKLIVGATREFAAEQFLRGRTVLLGGCGGRAGLCGPGGTA